jgi:hypothetical protein
MNPLIHAMVSGINSAAADHDLIRWPSEKVAFEVCANVARDLDGPEFLTEEGLAKESALAIFGRLKEAADVLAANGYGPSYQDMALAKQAAAMDVNDRAAIVAEACMTKAAEEASLTSVGPNTAQSAAAAEQVAALDLHNRAVNKYLMGVGRTAFPSGGVVGQQMLHPERQMGPAISNSLTALDKQAAYERDPQHLSTMAKRMLIGSGIGGALGAGGAALATEDDENRLRNALLGGLGGAALGAGAGYGYDRYNLLHGAMPEGGGPLTGVGTGRSALRPTEKMRAMPEGMSASTEGMLPVERFGVSPAIAPENTLLSNRGTKLPENYFSADGKAVTAAYEPIGAALDFISALNKTAGYIPDEVGVWAASGLAESGTAGLQAMNDIVHSVKTAAEADHVMRTVLANQQQLGMLGSAELATEVGHIVEADLKEQAGKAVDKAKEMAGKAKEHAGAAYGKAKEHAGAAYGKAKEHAGSAYGKAKEHAGSAAKYVKENKKPLAMGAGAALGTLGAAYGAKKLYDHMTDDDHKKKAFLLQQLKAAAEGSLTHTDENTPESAAHAEQVAALDMHNRRPSEYLTGVGRTRMPNAGHIGAAMDAPKHDGVDTHNTPSDELKHAADEQYLATFRKAAAAYGPMLPANMPKNEKIAHLQTIMGIVPDDREAYIAQLYR